MLFTTRTTGTEGTPAPCCCLHPSAEDDQPARGTEQSACLLFIALLHKTLMGINEKVLKNIKLWQPNRHC